MMGKTMPNILADLTANTKQKRIRNSRGFTASLINSQNDVNLVQGEAAKAAWTRSRSECGILNRE